MILICCLLFVFSFVTSTEAIPRRLNPQCRSNACDDRPVCPRTTCRCIFSSRMDCAVYYQCVNGKPFQYRCSPGLLFNSVTLSCDYSYNVNCSFTTDAPYSTETTNVTSSKLLPTTEQGAKTITTNITSAEFTSTQETTEITSRTMSSEMTTTEITKEEFTSSPTTEVPTSTKLATEEERTKSTLKPTTDRTTTETTFKIPSTIMSTFESIATEVTKEEFTSPETTEVPTTTIELSTEDERVETTQEPTTDRTTIMTTFKIPSTIMSTFESKTTEITKETSDSFISDTTQEFSTVVTTQNISTTTTPVTETITAEIIDKTSIGEETTKIPTTTSKISTTTEEELISTILTSTSTFTPSIDSSFSTEDYLITNATYTSTENNPTSTTKYPSAEFLCPERFGLFPDPKSCRRFYHCSHWKPYHKWCPSNLHFNPTLKVCDWPYRAGCDAALPTAYEPEDSSGSLNPNITDTTCDCDYCELPVLGDCAAYVVCVDRVATYMHCESDLYFNPMTATCDFPENVHCPKEDFQCPEPWGRYMLEGSCSYFVECRNGEKTTRKCPEGLQFNQTSEMCSWLGSCAGRPDGVVSSKIVADISICNGCDYCFKPYLSDCSRYIRCFQNLATEERCSLGLFFNPATEMCDHSYNVQCPSSESQPECPEPFGYFPYPGECGMYLHCINGTATEKTCPGVLHFDPVKKHCDWPWTAGCNDSNSRPDTDSSLETFDCDCDCCLKPVGTDCRSFILCINQEGFEGSCSSGLLFNSQTENCDFAENVDCPMTPEIPAYDCPEHQGLFPHPDDCEKFIHCSHGFPYVKDCPSHLHFNPKLKVCDWPYSAGCQGYPTTEPPMDDNGLPCEICDTCFIPDESDCASYLYCRNGTGHRLRCTENLVFNPETETCDEASNVKCPNQPSSQCPKADGLFPAKDCSQFIHCSNGIAYLKNCPDGLHFNAQILVCDWPENVICGGVPVKPTLSPPDDDGSGTADITCNCDCCFFPHEKDCSKYILCLDGYSHVGQCSRGLLFNPSLQNCDLAERVTCGEESPLCPESNGLFPNPGECSSFYKCSNGIANVETCQNGTHFSADKKQCLEPCKAQCDDSYNCSTNPEIVTPTSEPSICSEPDGFYPVANDCTSFYVCSDGRPEVVKCPNGLHYNSNFEVCEKPCEANCDPNINCDSSSSTSSSSTSSSSTSSSSTSSSTIPSSTTSSPYCPEKDGLFPNHEDCSSFYQCSEGRAYLVQCPSDLHFSMIDKVCEYPCEAKCNTSIDCSSSSPTSMSTTPSPHCLTPDGLYPVPGDCTAFYLCSNGKEYLIHCPPGLHFSELDETCEQPCDALCNITFNCGTTIQPMTSTPHSVSPECEEPDGLFPNSDDCGSFYQCSNGRSHLVRCPNDLHFSLEDSACERPCVAGCDISAECPPEIPETKGNCSCNNCYLPDPTDCSAFYFCESGELTKSYCPFETLFSKISNTCEDESIADCEANGDPSMCPEPYGFFPYPGDCRKFVHCDNNVAHVKECAEDLEYDPLHRVCTKAKGYCGEIVLDPNCPEPTGLFLDPTNCSLFYHCEHGVAYPKQCSSPLMFNPDKQVCDWPENVDCGRDAESNSTSATISSTQKSVNISTSNVTPSISPTPEISECHEVPGVICPCACRVPTYDECSSYFQCQEDGTACKKFCPEGLYFNKREMVCDLPENVECRDFFFTSIRRAKLFSHRLRS